MATYPFAKCDNFATAADKCLGTPLKCKLHRAEDLYSINQSKGKGCYLFSADMARAYHQLPLDPSNWCLTCFKTDSGFYADISLPFRLRWAAASCQRVTSLITHALAQDNIQCPVYIDDFAGFAASEL